MKATVFSLFSFVDLCEPDRLTTLVISFFAELLKVRENTKPALNSQILIQVLEDAYLARLTKELVKFSDRLGLEEVPVFHRIPNLSDRAFHLVDLYLR